jgi:hypothetical protein
MMVGLYDVYRSLIASKILARGEAAAMTHPFYGADSYDPELFISSSREIVHAQLRPPADTRVCGFKEIRWLDSSLAHRNLWHYLMFVERVLQDCRFILLTRDLDQISASGWWRSHDPDEVKASIASFYVLMRNAPVDVFEIDYSDFAGREEHALNKLFSFLGERYDPQAAKTVFDIRHSY